MKKILMTIPLILVAATLFLGFDKAVESDKIENSNPVTQRMMVDPGGGW